MKKLTLLFGLMLVILTSCDKFKEQDFDATLIKNFNVTIDENTGDASFTADEVMNLLDNEGLESVQESIKKYSVRKISYKVWEYTGAEDILMTGSIDLRTANGQPLYSHALNDINLKDLNEQEDHNSLPFTQEQKDEIAAEMLNGNNIGIRASGTISEVPATFILQVVADVTATAEIDD